jgi:NAD-dependent dihydropyrimidine dehydrogenase PreA subunit
MASRDVYEKLCKHYEFMIGKLPNREEFVEALRQTFSEDELRVIFLLPFTGEMSYETLEQKALKAGVSTERLDAIIRKLVPEGLIATYIHSDEVDHKGRAYPSPEPLTSTSGPKRVYLRGEIISMTEMQVRKPEHDPMRQAAAHWMDAMIESGASTIPTKTPYYRVIPIEPTLPEEPGKERIAVGEKIEDPRRVLPFDVVSDMVRRERVMAVADCYCRRTKTILGEGCDHPTETCIYFNELASLQLNAGRARRIDAEEAIGILKMAADAGLVHSVSNCEGRISCICNCCIHACGIMKSMAMGYRSAGAVSRYTVVYNEETCDKCGTCVETCPMAALSLNGRVTVDEERCIGCGVCAYKCPTESLSLTWREAPPRILPDGRTLMNRITLEALFGLVKQKVLGK